MRSPCHPHVINMLLNYYIRIVSALNIVNTSTDISTHTKKNTTFLSPAFHFIPFGSRTVTNEMKTIRTPNFISAQFQLHIWQSIKKLFTAMEYNIEWKSIELKCCFVQSFGRFYVFCLRKEIASASYSRISKTLCCHHNSINWRLCS